MSLSQKTAVSVMWKGASTLTLTALNFTILAALARLLAPSDFGLMGMLTAVIGFAGMLADLGLSAAVIHKQDMTREQFSTIFYLNVLIGLILTGACFLFSTVVASFFRQEALAGLMRLVSPIFAISGLSQSFDPLLQKNLDFKILFKIDISEIFLYGFISIFFAVNGFGVRSLVLGALFRVTARAVWLWIVAPLRPGLIFDLASVRSYLRYSLYIFGERILNYFSRNLDNIVIGRVLGAEALGYYALAYSLMLMPVSKIASSVTTVMFPAFSLVQSDNRKIREGYLRVVKFVSLLTFPMMAGLLVIAPEFIMFVYGPRWRPSIAVLQLFCLVGAAQSIVTTTGSVQYAKGRSDISFKWSIIALAVNASAFLIGVKWGIIGVAVGYAISACFLEPAIQLVTNRLIELPWRAFVKPFLVPLQGAALILAIVSAYKWILSPPIALAPAAELAVSVTLGIIVYTGFVLASKDRNFLREGIEFLGFNGKGKRS